MMRQASRREERNGRRDDFLQGNKGDVDGDDIRHLSYIIRCEETGVHVLEKHDPAVRPQLFVELMGAHVDGVDFVRTRLQQEVDEAAGGGAYVDSRFPTRVYPELPDGLFELHAPVTHVGDGIRPHLE